MPFNLRRIGQEVTPRRQWPQRVARGAGRGHLKFQEKSISGNCVFLVLSGAANFRGKLPKTDAALPGTNVSVPGLPECRKTYRGPGMSAASVAACYRLYAAYCVESAQHVLDLARKITLLEMAQAWMKLADLVEREVPTIENGESNRNEQPTA